MKRNQLNIILAISLIAMAATARIVNADAHLYNFAPVAALGLFSGAVIKDRRIALIMALAGQFCADLYFQLFTNTPGFYGISQVFTYGGLLSVAVLGMYMKLKPANIAIYTFAGSTLFFLISNFGTWLSGMWGLNGSGLLTNYIAAIPFFKNAIIGDMIGSTLLFGGYFLLQKAFTARLQKAQA